MHVRNTYKASDTYALWWGPTSEAQSTNQISLIRACLCNFANGRLPIFFQQFLIDRVINTSWDDINYAKKRGSETKMKVGPRLKSETCNTRRVVGLNRRIMYVHGLAILAQTWARKLSLILPISEVNETICITRTGWPTNLIQFLCVCLSQLAP